MDFGKTKIAVTINIDETTIDEIADSILDSVSDALDSEGLPRAKEVKLLILKTAIKQLEENWA